MNAFRAAVQKNTDLVDSVFQAEFFHFLVATFVIGFFQSQKEFPRNIRTA